MGARHDANGTHIAIVNPEAGGGRCGRRAPEALDRLRRQGLEVEVHETEAPRDATRIAREAFDAGYRRFIAVGGDGTNWEVLNGLAPRGFEDGRRARLGFLPLGTGNSFLLDFSRDGTDYAMRALIEDRHRASDVLCLHHAGGRLYFINLCTFGFPTEVTLTARDYKRNRPFPYILAVLRTVARLRFMSLPMRCDGGELDAADLTFVCVCNTRYTAGAMMMAPGASACDGLAHLVRVEPMSRLEVVKTFPKIYRGTHVENPAVSVRTARRIDFETAEPIQVMIDGEVVEIVPERIEVLSGALEIAA